MLSAAVEHSPMIFEDNWTEPDARGGRPVKTHRVRFSSQQEQGLFLRNMVDTFRHTNAMRQWATGVIFAGCRPKQRLCHALRLARWVQEHVRYVNEGDETFQVPPRTLRFRFGDCDDFSTLIATGLEAVGIKCELVLMWIADPPGRVARALEGLGIPWEATRTGSYRHIFPRAVIPVGKGILRVPLDATLTARAGRANPLRIAARRGDKVRTLVL